MCKYCEPSPRGICKPLAVNDIGFKVPLALYARDENTGEPVLQVNYDEQEPLQISANFCLHCGRKL